MTVVTQPTSVFVAARDASIRSAIARLLSLEKGVFVAGSGTRAPEGTVDVIIDDSMLELLKHCTIAEFLATVRGGQTDPHERHLRPLASGRDMRADLSERELQVVRLVADGLSNKQISILLKLSDKTVKNHISHILAKLNLSARTQVAVHALRAGLV
jgi:DNA-binding CsgD family transcriptional regulator